MSVTREIPPPEWRGWMEELNRRANERPLHVVLRIDCTIEAERFRDLPVGEKLELAAIELDTKGPGGGAIDVVLHAADGDFGLHLGLPSRLATRERDDGELECLEIEDAAGTRLVLYGEAHPEFVELSSAGRFWWRRPLLPIDPSLT